MNIKSLNYNTYLKNDSLKKILSDIENINILYKRLLDTLNQNMSDCIEGSDFISSDDKQIFSMFLTHFFSMHNPDNNFFLNAKVIDNYFQSNGTSLFKGMSNFIQDCYNLDMVYVDKDYYVVGENICCTKGCVVYENKLLQLIYYNPVVADNYTIPILIVPPFINKYYVFDMSEENSFVKYLLKQGYSVYMISWVNPSFEHNKYDISDYLIEGILQVMNFIITHHKISKINLIGYCISAVMLAILLSYLKKQKINIVLSLTLIAMMLDYTNNSFIKAAINKGACNVVDSLLTDRGIVSGLYMKHFFSFLKPKEMLWWTHVNRYLMGFEPIRKDILFWNDDSMNIIHNILKFITQDLYRDNRLIIPNNIEILDTPISLKDIDVPCFIVSCKKDHITPWQDVYNSSRFLVNADVQFILTGSGGHITGVMNSPQMNSYDFYQGNILYDKNPIEWLTDKESTNGSWWDFWHDWQKKYSGQFIRPIKYSTAQIISKAPGSYVKMPCLKTM